MLERLSINVHAHRKQVTKEFIARNSSLQNMFVNITSEDGGIRYCNVSILSFATTRGGKLRVHGPIYNCCCVSGKSSAHAASTSG